MPMSSAEGGISSTRGVCRGGCPPYLYSRQRLFEFGFQWLKKWVWFFLPPRDTLFICHWKSFLYKELGCGLSRILQLWHSFSFWFEGIQTARYSGADGCVPKTRIWGLGFRKLLPLDRLLLQHAAVMCWLLWFDWACFVIFPSFCHLPLLWLQITPLWLPNWRISPSSFPSRILARSC